MIDRAKVAADRIREHVPILQVLVSYGYHVRDDGGAREQQFACDLHGTGQDNTPSARVYPDSQSYYCFGCGKSRDAIEIVRAKDGVKFWQAVKILETAYGLDPLPVDYGYDDTPNAVNLLKAILDPTRTFDQDAAKVHRFLDNRTQDRDLPLNQILRFWEKYDEIVHYVKGPKGDGGIWTEDTGRAVLQGLLDKINEAVKAQRDSG